VVGSEEKAGLSGVANFNDLAVLVSTNNVKALRRFSSCEGSSEFSDKGRLEDLRGTSGSCRKNVSGEEDKRALAICCSSSDTLSSGSEVASFMVTSSSGAAARLDDSAIVFWLESASSEGRTQK